MTRIATSQIFSYALLGVMKAQQAQALASKQVSTGLTTPDIVTFLSNMAGLRMEGVTHAAFEASSHGLAQFRTEGLPVNG